MLQKRSHSEYWSERPEAIESHHVLHNRLGQIVDILFVIKWQGYKERSLESIRNVRDYGVLFENYVFDQSVTTSRRINSLFTFSYLKLLSCVFFKSIQNANILSRFGYFRELYYCQNEWYANKRMGQSKTRKFPLNILLWAYLHRVKLWFLMGRLKPPHINYFMRIIFT